MLNVIKKISPKGNENSSHSTIINQVVMFPHNDVIANLFFKKSIDEMLLKFFLWFEFFKM